ncbi:MULTISPECIES: hypothetical protein [unclassified Bacillus (in: firmicutes)]
MNIIEIEGLEKSFDIGDSKHAHQLKKGNKMSFRSYKRKNS